MADVAGLAIQDDGNVVRDVHDRALQGDHACRPPLQVKAKIRLIGAYQVGRRIYDRLVERQQRFIPFLRRSREPGRVRVQADAQPGSVALLGGQQFL